MIAKLNETLQTIEQYKNVNPHYEELLDILGEILILREEFRRKTEHDIYTVEETLINKKIRGGMPLVDFFNGDINLKEAEKYFTALLELADEKDLGEAKEITHDLEEGKIDFLQMVRDSFNAEPEEETFDEEEEDTFFDLLGFLVEESLRPSLEILSEKYGDLIEKSNWSEGYCPICGREPKIAELRDEVGQKFLFCSQCGFEWRFPRLKCPFCSNEDQQSLAYFTVEDEEKYRVDVCNVCNRYIKTVDFREYKIHPNLDVEDIATLHLDILANDEGYD
ncbi:MAG: formate dehydrogenase accessory protein FdhE [Syntrophales bacterium]|nr:formate dehydrogenase accessory protein FdhE [Syntrophales bacterium]MDY0043874.1 formate dehydrogenase accessory protein FdhE [Syntrophales bacterium]